MLYWHSIQEPSRNTMSVDKKLLDILCCPVTKQPVRPLEAEALKRLNAQIEQGQVRQMDDTPVEAPLREALITENGQRIYPVEDGIPIMLEERAIPASAAKQPSEA